LTGAGGTEDLTMTIKTMSVILDLATERPAVALATDLAKRLGAQLTGVAPIFDPLIPAYAATPMPAELLVATREHAVDQAQKAAKAFKDGTAAAGIGAESFVADVVAGGYFDALLDHCRLSDLVVIGQDHPVQTEPARIPAIEAVMFRSGAPLLLVPRDGEAVLNEENAMIAWDGSGPAARAVRDALPLLERAKTVEVVSVGNAGDDQDVLSGLIAYLARHGVNATAKVIARDSAGIADTLIAHASAIKAGWMVMGGYGHSRLREFVVGGTTRHMIDAATLPVFMAH